MSDEDWKLVLAAIAGIGALLSALSSWRSSRVARTALRSNIRPVLVSDGVEEISTDLLDRTDTGLPVNGHLLQVRNDGLGPALNVVARTRLYYMGFADRTGESYPRSVPSGSERTLEIYQETHYLRAAGTAWSVRVTYEDANDATYWLALDFGRRTVISIENGSGSIPRRLRWYEGVASWDNGPTITYGFIRRQALRTQLASQRIAIWYWMPRGQPIGGRIWTRMRTLPWTLRFLLRGPVEYADGESVRRGWRRWRSTS
ncbi:MAG TPA: hypothetical protein VKB03_11765 [Conexibacter sp.]|nr:hypothetical protein [Conexibacter sp.]